MSNEKHSMIEKVNEILGDERELIVLKGKLYQPLQEHRKEDNQPYYSFKLKVIKKINDDMYSQGYNSYSCIMPVERSKQISTEEMRAMKDNEVICLCSARASVRSFANKTTGEQVTVNNINLYVVDLMFTREIKKEVAAGKALRI